MDYRGGGGGGILNRISCWGERVEWQMVSLWVWGRWRSSPSHHNTFWVGSQPRFTSSEIVGQGGVCSGDGFSVNGRAGRHRRHSGTYPHESLVSARSQARSVLTPAPYLSKNYSDPLISLLKRREQDALSLNVRNNSSHSFRPSNRSLGCLWCREEEESDTNISTDGHLGWME